MRTPFKAVLLLSIVSFLFLGCEQEKLLPASDDPISLETTGTTVYHERVAAIDIPEISDMISQNIGGEKGVLKMQTHNSKNIGSYTVNWDEVNLITDSLGIENYAFRLETENPDPLVFYNVIATKDAEGELLNPVIAEYVMDQAFALQWRLDPDKLRDFRGAVYYYDMAGEAYSKTGKGAVLNALRDGPPCPSITFGPTGPNNTIPNIYCWSYISYGLCETQIEYGGTGYHTAESGCHAGTGSPIMGYGVTCSTSPGGSGGGDVQKAAMTSRCGSGGGRPALPGGVPINPGSPGEADFGSFVGMLDNDIQLTLAQEEFLEEGPEVELVLELQLYLDKEENSAEAKEFARNVVSYIMQVNDPTPTSEEREFIADVSEYMKNSILPEQTTRAELIEQIQILTGIIKKFGSASEKQMADSLEQVNQSLNERFDSELYTYYELLYNLRFDMQKRRVMNIVVDAALAFQPVIEVALWEVGGAFALKILGKLPSALKSLGILRIIENLKISSSLSKFAHAQKYGFQTYAQHVKFFSDMNISRSKLGIEVHHLIEKRFVKNNAVAAWIGRVESEIQSIVLTKAEHKIFTDKWKSAIGYDSQAAGTTGFNTSTVPLDVLKAEAKKIYKEYPDIIRVLGL